MKIAILHNFMDNIGGAEIVSLILARELNADLYTTNFNAERTASVGFADVVPRIISVGKVPARAPFRHQLALRIFRKLNLGKKYDFYIISGDWAIGGAVNNKPNLWYAHGPLNELWAFKDFVGVHMMPFWKRPIFEVWVMLNRFLTVRYSKHVGSWVCNSNNSKNRIKKYYKKDATVVYPPIETNKYLCGEDKGYWLSVNRLLDNKRVDIQIKAFAKMPDKKLVIVGSYEKGARQFEKYKEHIESMLTPNIVLRHWVPSGELIDLYSHCIGFITTSKDEDFGMTAVEAMASGKPVIAPNEGGYRENVIDGKTGVLINDIDAEKLAVAVQMISKELGIKENRIKYQCDCQVQAKKFDTKIFVSNILAEIMIR